MKKCLFILSLCALTSSIFAATFGKQEWITEAEQKIAKDSTNCYAHIIKQIWSMETAPTLAQMESIASEYIKNYSSYPKQSIYNHIAVAVWRGIMNSTNKADFVDLYEFSKKYNVVGIQVRLITWIKVATVTDKELNALLYTYFYNNGQGLDLYDVNKFSTTYFKTLEKSDETVVKSQLKSLNRVYSPKLLDDKASWEKFIAKIRTCMELY